MAEINYTILLVDDNTKAREALSEFFQLRFPEALLLNARDGDAALKIVMANHVDLVITDEVMPRKSGMTMIKEATAAGISCPFIVLTGLRAQDIHVPKADARRIRIMEKPLKFDDLQQVIKELLSLPYNAAS